jgi:hypothetical protein
MSADTVVTYLRDHLAGARAALDLLEYLREEAPEPEVQELAGQLHAEISEERAWLEGLAKAVGGSTNPLKEAAAWLAERVSRLKLGREGEGEGGLALFEAVETLALALQGKLALARALAIAAGHDRRLRGVDFVELGRRTERQFARVERTRQGLVPRVFAP